MSFSLEEHNLFSRLLVNGRAIGPRRDANDGFAHPLRTCGMESRIVTISRDDIWTGSASACLSRETTFSLVFAVTLAPSTLWEFPHWRYSLIIFGVHVHLLEFIGHCMLSPPEREWLSLEFTAGMFFCMAIHLLPTAGIVSPTPRRSLAHKLRGHRSPAYRVSDPGRVSRCIRACNEALPTGRLANHRHSGLGGFLIDHSYVQEYHLPHRETHDITVPRIGLYPFVSRLLNVSAAVLDLRVMSQQNPLMALSVAGLPPRVTRTAVL
ncbi:hypothetical protein DFH06DRAFT_1327366 [Mycena polygramma]|nr:hypothetical protein DFH06DRAFT_1327366 [Mycena polygramma]